jgi:hypothetical protein
MNGWDTALLRAAAPRASAAKAEPPLDALALRLLAAKYQDRREGRPLSEWARTALPVEVTFAGRPAGGV